MNISKYIDFYLVTGVSTSEKSKGKPYYAIAIRIQDKDFILCFMNKDRYDLLTSSLSK